MRVQAQGADQERWFEMAREILARRLGGLPIDVYLFGSRARGDARAASDIDLGLDVHGEVPRTLLSDLTEDFEESLIPVRVDVIDLRDAGPKFREQVRREGLPWTVSGSD